MQKLIEQMNSVKAESSYLVKSEAKALNDSKLMREGNKKLEERIALLENKLRDLR